jgi:hypothetical protein
MKERMSGLKILVSGDQEIVETVNINLQDLKNLQEITLMVSICRFLKPALIIN